MSIITKKKLFSSQIQDLELAENELRSAIKELRTLIKSKFF